MVLKRITKHPILEIPESKEVAFTWNGKKLTGYEGEMISAALFANGIHIFLRQWSMFPMPGHRRWSAGQIVYDPPD
jgi:hypothetical protein